MEMRLVKKMSGLVRSNGRKIIRSGLAIFLISTILYACVRVPMTGRRQLNLLPESDLVAMSLTEYKNFLNENNVVNSGPNQEAIQRVGDRISSAVETYLESTKYAKRVKNYNWEFNLVQDPTMNAWCMPGGKVVFYTGILPVCESDAGIAVVMGHEIAHAIARHGNERMSQQMAIALGGVALDVAVSDKPEETRNLYNLAYGIGSTVGVMLPYSRLHESEADKLGLMFMAMAGYDPQEAPRFWERMESLGSLRPPEFLSTHPNPDTRIADLEAQMPKAMELYNKQQEK